MRLLDHSNASPSFSPAQDLAIDEILLQNMASQAERHETLRIWEAAQTTVVLGRSSRVESEVHIAKCNELSVPILRRCSGGCAIVAGPGCLMYSVVLDLTDRPHLRVIDQAHEFVLEKTLAALRQLNLNGLAREGLSDLVVVNKSEPVQRSATAQQQSNAAHKFSGNSLRITRDALLYHGTILYEFPIARIADLLRTPPREPTYRKQRNHHQFVRNLDIARDQIISALCDAWKPETPARALSIDIIDALVSEKYDTHEWNYRH